MRHPALAMLRAVACVVLALAGVIARAQTDDPGLPTSDLPKPRIAIPDISGKWRAGDKDLEIVQEGAEVKVRASSGRTYEGSLTGRHISASYRIQSGAQVPERVPIPLRDQLVGSVVRLEGDVASDGKSIDGETVDPSILELDAQGSTITRMGETRRSIKLMRAKPPVKLVAVYFPYDQAAPRNGAVYKHPANDSSGIGQRDLLVVGKNLPTEYGDAKLSSPDAAIRYEVLRLSHDASNAYQDEYAAAVNALLQSLDDPDRTLVNDLDRMLVRAKFGRTVLPGTKTLTLNGQSAKWKLEFGDTWGELHFVRATDEASFEETDDVFVPESVALELRTTVKLEIPQYDLVVQSSSGMPPVALAAKFASRSGDADRGEAYVYRYRTGPMRIIDAGRPGPVPEGEAPVAASPNDGLLARMKQPEWLLAPPARAGFFNEAGASPRAVLAHANVRRSPAEMGALWKEALTSAAQCAGKPVEDFAALSKEQAAEITNYILFTTDDLANRFLDGRPFYARKLSVQVRDHAAMLLLRDEFVRMMQEHAAQLPGLEGDDTLRGFRKMITPYIDDPAFPLSHIRVTPPSLRTQGCGPAGLDEAFASLVTIGHYGDSCPLSYATNDDFLQRTFRNDRAGAERWSLGAVKEAFGVYRNAVDKTLAEARGLDRCDVTGLLKLTGYGFAPVVARLLPRLMRLDDSGGAANWVPDQPARAAVSGLSILADAVRAQKDYSSADTQAILMVAGTVAMLPAMISGAPLAALLSAAGNVAVAGTDAIIQVKDYVDSTSETRRAMGASGVLGTARLSEAELRQTSVWQLALAMANVGLAGSELVGAIGRAQSLARGAELLADIENGGTAALRRLSKEEQADVLAFIADSELAQAKNGESALTASQRRGINVGGMLDADPRISAELARLNGVDPGSYVAQEIDSLRSRDPDAVRRAHEVGAGEVGADGVRPAGIDNYTQAQLRDKAQILRDAGFTPEETRLLVEEGVVGNQTVPDFSPPTAKSATQGWVVGPDGQIKKVGSPRNRPGGASSGWDWSTEAREYFTRSKLQDAAATAAHHAEGQAVAWMWENVKEGESMKVWLDINNNYICSDCLNTIGSLIPPNSELVVRYKPPANLSAAARQALEAKGVRFVFDKWGDVKYAYKSFWRV